MPILNGRIPTVGLHYVGKNSAGKKLYVQRGKMARGLDLVIRMLAIYGFKVWLTDAYRTLAEQRAARTFWANLGQWWKAAEPGYSNHGLAKAVDFTAPLNVMGKAHDVARWLLPLLGFSWEQGKKAGEPWHWVWVGFPKRTTLRIGAEDREVRLWQLYIRLTKIKIDGKAIVVDGQYGPTTAKFTKARQKQLKIKQTGVVDQATWKKARLV